MGGSRKLTKDIAAYLGFGDEPWTPVQRQHICKVIRDGRTIMGAQGVSPGTPRNDLTIFRNTPVHFVAVSNPLPLPKVLPFKKLRTRYYPQVTRLPERLDGPHGLDGPIGFR